MNQESPRGVAANVLDSDMVLKNLNSSRAITFKFELTPLGKVWTLLSPNYGLNSTITVIQEGWRWH